MKQTPLNEQRKKRIITNSIDGIKNKKSQTWIATNIPFSNGERPRHK